VNFVTPCGIDNPAYNQAVKQTYLSLRSSYGGYNPLPVSDPYNLKVQAITWNTTPEQVVGWIQDANASRSWLILMFHQIQLKEEKYAVSPANFRKMVEAVALSKIPVVLPAQALQLVDDASEPENSTEASPSASVTIGKTAAETLRVRIEPNFDATVSAWVKTGQSYRVIETQNDWLLIDLNSSATPSGWISKRYVKP
jgi:hypothetical protein